MMCHESSSQSWVIDCRNPLIARLSTSFVKTWVFVCRCHLAAFHLRSSAVSCCGRPIFLWALLCPSFCQLWQRLCDSGRLCSTHGWMFGLFFCFFFRGHVSPLRLGCELARVADIPLSGRRAGVEVFLGGQRSGVCHHGGRHLGHQSLGKVRSE